MLDLGGAYPLRVEQPEYADEPDDGRIEDEAHHRVCDFAEGRVQLVAVKAYDDGLMVGRALKTMNEVVPGIDMRVAAIFREGESIQPSAECVIQARDEVFFLAAREHIPTVISEMRKLERLLRCCDKIFSKTSSFNRMLSRSIVVKALQSANHPRFSGLALLRNNLRMFLRFAKQEYFL